MMPSSAALSVISTPGCTPRPRNTGMGGASAAPDRGPRPGPPEAPPRWWLLRSLAACAFTARSNSSLMSIVVRMCESISSKRRTAAMAHRGEGVDGSRNERQGGPGDGRQHRHRQGDRAIARPRGLQGRDRGPRRSPAPGRGGGDPGRDRLGGGRLSGRPHEQGRRRPSGRADRRALRPHRHPRQQRGRGAGRGRRDPGRGRLGARNGPQVHGLRVDDAGDPAPHEGPGTRAGGQPHRQRRREALLLGDRTGGGQRGRPELHHLACRAIREAQHLLLCGESGGRSAPSAGRGS